MHFCADEVDKERPGVGGVLKHQHKTARHVSLTANHFLPHLVMATLRGGGLMYHKSQQLLISIFCLLRISEAWCQGSV